jgi:WD40 repeat protein
LRTDSTSAVKVYTYQINESDISRIYNVIPNDELVSSSGLNALAISPDSKFVFAIIANRGVVFKRSTSTNYIHHVSLDLGSLHNNFYSAVFSSDGKYLYITYSSSSSADALIRYKINGDTFTKLPSLVQPPGAGAYEVTVSDLQPYFALALTGDPYIAIYKADIEGDYAYKYTGFDHFNVRNYVNFGYARTSGSANTSHTITTLPIK